MHATQSLRLTQFKAEPVPGHSYKWQVSAVDANTGNVVVLTQHGSREDAFRRLRWERAVSRQQKA